LQRYGQIQTSAAASETKAPPRFSSSADLFRASVDRAALHQIRLRLQSVCSWLAWHCWQTRSKRCGLCCVHQIRNLETTEAKNLKKV